MNHRGDIVKAIGEEGVKKLLHDAEMDHCLSFEQVSDEVISYYKLKREILIRYQIVNIQFQVFLILENYIVL